jgi:NAD(P)-dependent dehydrogenase (short-subunit alcohol dehydrogenase family)
MTAAAMSSVHVGDVGEAEFARATVERVVAKCGRLDVLMTAAGFSCGGAVVITDPTDWDAVFRTNVGGTWLWGCAAVPIMQRQGKGAIITLASQLAIAGGRGNSAYIAAKGAIISLTRTMAVDFATDGIRVNAIAPGAIDTPLLRRSFARHTAPDPVREASRQHHAMKHTLARPRRSPARRSILPATSRRSQPESCCRSMAAGSRRDFVCRNDVFVFHCALLLFSRRVRCEGESVNDINLVQGMGRSAA